MNRWSKAGVLDRVFARLQAEQILSLRMELACLDSTTVKVHPDGTGGFEKSGPQAIGRSRGGCTTKIHLVAANARCALSLKLSPGQAGDAPEGRRTVTERRAGASRLSASSWIGLTRAMKPANWHAN